MSIVPKEAIEVTSIVPKEAIEVIAQSIGITNLSPEVALALAPDVEYRVREIMQEAIKCMRHSRRTTLTAEDVDSALSLRNVDPVYGFASGDPLRFKRAAGHKDLYYIDDKDVEFKDVIEAPLPNAPLDTSVKVHWLAIEGVQPAIPENAPLKEDGLPVDVKLPVKHVLSKELQSLPKKSGSILFKQALVSLATDSGLHPLLPYFTYLIADEVARNLNNFSVLFALMRVAQSLLQNPHIHVEPYPRHKDSTPCILGPNKIIASHYGAVQGLAALGPNVVRLLILPNLEPYLLLLEPEMLLEKQKNEIKRLEAWRVLGP
ncbi:hypothetical protein GH714_007284 [Hevea brasiliensis]|uniref:TATA box binding protein associated factor (TAF) histone-like fold domain-containing protein n=1 Tax=Hevea brasiliensis TaxID=3981 RepID=A0A6A6KA15_HEVBR|nr:hypothetical protein GH714_007284 [Hevea brasiliensis]